MNKYKPIPLRYYNTNSTLQEVPDELSLCINVAGCPNQCPGCSWREVTKTMERYEMNIDDLQKLLTDDKHLHSCICFMGGEWFNDFPLYLQLAKEMGYNTCLYTGSPDISTAILHYLDYIKIGAYNQELGGLDSPKTNQKFITLGDKTSCFQKNR